MLEQTEPVVEDGEEYVCVECLGGDVGDEQVGHLHCVSGQEHTRHLLLALASRCLSELVVRTALAGLFRAVTLLLPPQLLEQEVYALARSPLALPLLPNSNSLLLQHVDGL